MLSIKKLVVLSLLASTLAVAMPSEAMADGPLRRWLRGLWDRNGSQTCNTCNNGFYQPQTAGYAPNPYNLQPGQCMKTCQQTCTRTVVNYVPQTAYRTAWKPVPVTSYKPVTNTDPCTGCTVTCMRPCTTYTYQCQRVPYTTYRPVYRQETYKVPVTTITNDCATGTCNTGCATCPTAPQQSFAPTPAATTSNFAPQTYAGAPSTTTSTYYETPEGTIVPQGSSSPTPANIAPSLDGSSTRNLVNPQSLQKPFLERYQSSYSKVSDRSHIPARINIEDRTAQSPVRKNWSYSPVRLAGYEKPMTTRASYSPIQRAPRNESRNQALNGWTEVK